MSKAFTRESDDLPDRLAPVRLRSALPAGVRNNLTPDGARRFREELDRLVAFERPSAAQDLDRDERRRRVHLLDQRIADLELILRTAQVVPPPAAPWEHVRFGAIVTVRDEAGAESTYRIVGVAEADAERGWIGWRSPLARALLGAVVGQQVRLALPDGERALEIRRISYE